MKTNRSKNIKDNVLKKFPDKQQKPFVVGDQISHGCQLPPAKEEIYRYIRGSGCWKSFKRRFIKFRLPSNTCPRCRTYLKSKYLLTDEKYRQLNYFPYMIHPFSEFRIYWDLLLALIFTISIIMVPVRIATEESGEFSTLDWLMFVIDCVALVDIGVSFATGIFDEHRQVIVLKPKKVALIYLHFDFWLDVMSTVPLHFLVIKLNIRFAARDVLYLLKIFRYNTMRKYVRNTYDNFEIRMFHVHCIKLFIVGTTILWCSCLTYYFTIYGVIRKIPEKSWLDIKILMEMDDYGFVLAAIVYRTTTMIISMTCGSNRSYQIQDQVLVVIFIIAGFIIHIYIISYVFRYSLQRSSNHYKYQVEIRQVKDFMLYRNFPDYMKRRILDYYSYRFDKSFYNEREIMTTIPAQLQKEIISFASLPLLQNVPIFEPMPTEFLVTVGACLRSEIFLQNDIIIPEGVRGECMYFIKAGTVAIFKKNKEICHLEDGAHFGEMALVLEKEIRIATVIAVETCELFVLEKRDFRRVMVPHPGLFRCVRRKAFSKIEKTLKLRRSVITATATPLQREKQTFTLTEISGVLETELQKLKLHI